MKIFAYRINRIGPAAFDTLIQSILDRPLEQRAFAGDGMRLEAAQSFGHLLALDFAKPRSGHGPGRMAPNAPITEFDIGDHESFGEDTAIVYDTRERNAAIQYNHYGPRASAIERYLNTADTSINGAPASADEPRGFEFSAWLKEDAYARLREFGLIQDIEFKISIPGARRADLEAGQSLSGILRAPLPEGAETIFVRLSARASRDGELGFDGAWRLINDIRLIAGDVLSAKVGGKETAEAKKNSVDLVEEQLSIERSVAPGRGQRIARGDRWNALREVLTNWQSSGQLS